MGKRGPKPTPTAELKRRGSWRALHRPDHSGPEVVAPAPPKSLAKDLVKRFEEHAQGLADYGVMTNFDAVALSILVQMLDVYDRATAAWVEDGRPFYAVGEKGGRARDPGYAAMLDSWEKVLKGLREFGLTPSSRSSVVPSKPPEKPGKKDRKRHLQPAGPQKVEKVG